MSQQAVSADIFPKFSCWNISSLGILISWIPHKFRRLKILDPLSNFKNPTIVKLITFRHRRAESEVAEMSSYDQANRGGNLGLVWRNRKKIIAKLSMTTFTYRSSS
jgi:hypothetical protein